MRTPKSISGRFDPQRRRVFPEAIFAVHLDHGDEETAMDCIESAYSSVMIDASHGFETNIAITRRGRRCRASWLKLNWVS